MPKESITPQQAKAFLDQRWENAIARATPEFMSTGDYGERHEWQIKILNCLKQNIILMCSRRAGKSEVCVRLILLTAIKTRDVSCLYLGLTKDAAEPVWRKWKKLLKRLGIPHTSSDPQQFTEFPNGSRVLFTGTDDLRTVSHLLGDQLAGGIAVIDECQSDPGLMQTTIEDVLGPMLDETTHDKPIPGRLVLSGTVPDGPIGYYWSSWIDNRNSDDTATKEGSRWETFCWSRYENPFQTDSKEREDAYCEKYNKKHDDPAVRRRFHGERVWGKESNAFRFDKTDHVYAPSTINRTIGPFDCRFAIRNPAIDRFIVGIQQASHEGRFSIVAFGWNGKRKNAVWHVAEAVTDIDGDPLESEWIAICAELRRMYPVGSMEFIRDSDTSSDPVNEALFLSHGIEVKSAIKTPGNEKARVQRLSDLLAIGVSKIMKDSELAKDMQISRWSKQQIRGKTKRKWELDVTHVSPDVAKAATYAFDLPSYTMIGGMKPPPKRMTLDERLAAERQKTLDQLASGRLPRSPSRPPAYVSLWLPPPK